MNKLPIVVADDDPAAVTLLKMCLTKIGYEVLMCENGQEALRLVMRNEPVILLTDWNMPGLSGLELCRRIRASARDHIVYIILVTGNSELGQIVDGLEAGADDYLVKPVNVAELQARIRAGERLLELQLRQREDATALKIKNAELERAKHRAEKALSELEQAHSQLLQADKMSSIGQLAAGVAHEINNPVGFISSNLNSLGRYVKDLKRVLEGHEALLSECLAGASAVLPAKAAEVRAVREEVDVDFLLSDIADLIAESVEGTQRVRQIVSDLRDFSHVDNPDVSDEDINRLLDKTINVAWNELKYKAEVVREYGEIPAIPCYGGKLGQVFLNLLVNAAQAIEERGTITVRTGRENSHVWIEVADTGCGIPPENLKRVFDPFFTTKEVGKGTGMGLNLAYKIIDAHAGRMTVESTVGKGTTFRIELPTTGPLEPKEQQDGSVA